MAFLGWAIYIIMIIGMERWWRSNSPLKDMSELLERPEDEELHRLTIEEFE